jgi:hypothetical protein
MSLSLSSSILKAYLDASLKYHQKKAEKDAEKGETDNNGGYKEKRTKIATVGMLVGGFLAIPAVFCFFYIRPISH